MYTHGATSYVVQTKWVLFWWCPFLIIMRFCVVLYKSVLLLHTATAAAAAASATTIVRRRSSTLNRRRLVLYAYFIYSFLHVILLLCVCLGNDRDITVLYFPFVSKIIYIIAVITNVDLKLTEFLYATYIYTRSWNPRCDFLVFTFIIILVVYNDSSRMGFLCWLSAFLNLDFNHIYIYILFVLKCDCKDEESWIYYKCIYTLDKHWNIQPFVKIIYDQKTRDRRENGRESRIHVTYYNDNKFIFETLSEMDSKKFSIIYSYHGNLTQAYDSMIQGINFHISAVWYIIILRCLFHIEADEVMMKEPFIDGTSHDVKNSLI